MLTSVIGAVQDSLLRKLVVDAAHFLPLLFDSASVWPWVHLQDSLSLRVCLVECRQLHGEWDAQAQIAVSLQVLGDLETFAAYSRWNEIETVSLLEEIQPFGIVGGSLVPAVISPV